MRYKAAQEIRSRQAQESFDEAVARTIHRVGQPVRNVPELRKSREEKHDRQQQREQYSQCKHHYLPKDVSVIPFRNNFQHERQVMEQQLHGYEEAFANQQWQQIS